jgi:hypothetical protein
MRGERRPEPDGRRERRHLQAGILIAIAFYFSLAWLLFGR